MILRFILTCFGALVLIGTLYDVIKQHLQRISPKSAGVKINSNNENANEHASNFNNPSYEEKEVTKVIIPPSHRGK